MRLMSICALATVLGITCGAAAQANKWCAGANGGNWLFCDDFDSYCTPVPTYPATCTTSDSPSDPALQAVWQWQGACGYQVKVYDPAPSTTGYRSYPYSARHLQADNESLSYHRHGIINEIQTIDPAKDAVAGTTASPLILDFYFDTLTANKQDYNNSYVELSLGNERAPTDYVLSDNCSTFCPPPGYGPNRRFTMICQQNAPPANCPPLMTTPRASIAAGFLAILDNNPCHCGTTNQRPQNWHLSVFDGLKWWTLKSGTFPGSGDFNTGTRFNRVVLTITETNINVRLNARIDASNYVDSFADIPRQYTGPFNALSYGMGHGCELSSTTHECLTPGSATCLNGTPGSGANQLDNLVLYGGVLTGLSAACCLPDLSCVDTTADNCAIMGGEYRGYGTSCASTVCCATPFADSDLDTDVDHADFGAFQVCYTGSTTGVPSGCGCFDRNSDNKVDGADYAQFNNCYTGGNVPWSQALTPSCSP
ncbi:MAG TPA: hypothetical protein VLM89_01845 [Phycisphaerae bacterium]|nr:hypothetical protein [Phycisphaerae bacterium]